MMEKTDTEGLRFGRTAQDLRNGLALRFPVRLIPLREKITALEVGSATTDLPGNEAAGPNLIAAEIYNRCAALRKR